MMENRSFDHMLGYLSLPAAAGGRGAPTSTGCGAGRRTSTTHGGQRYPIHHLDRTKFEGEAEDPDHSGESVDEQLANGGQGFVDNFARISAARAQKLKVPVPDPGLVMGYYDADDLPVYDHLAARVLRGRPLVQLGSRRHLAQPAIRDGGPGGRAAATTSRCRSTRCPASSATWTSASVDWRWYSFDPATLRAADPEYRLSHHDRFALRRRPQAHVAKRRSGELTEKGLVPGRRGRAASLPRCRWIDPRFKDLRVLGPDSNDDHPPSRRASPART